MSQSHRTAFTTLAVTSAVSVIILVGWLQVDLRGHEPRNCGTDGKVHNTPGQSWSVVNRRMMSIKLISKNELLGQQLYLAILWII